MTGWFVRFPSSATTFQHTLAAVDAARLSEIPIPIAALWDPWKCPATLLPFLAWSLSVDIWDDDWPEELKRKIIAAAPMVHRLKGTLGAVRRALAAFDLETRIVEWWEDGGRHGTFRIEMIYRNGGPAFDLSVQALAVKAVLAAKPKSRVFTTRFVAEARGTLHVGAFAQSAIVAIAHPLIFEPPVLRAARHIGATAVTINSHTAHARR